MAPIKVRRSPLTTARPTHRLGSSRRTSTAVQRLELATGGYLTHPPPNSFRDNGSSPIRNRRFIWHRVDRRLVQQRNSRLPPCSKHGFGERSSFFVREVAHSFPEGEPHTSHSSRTACAAEPSSSFRPILVNQTLQRQTCGFLHSRPM